MGADRREARRGIVGDVPGDEGAAAHDVRRARTPSQRLARRVGPKPPRQRSRAARPRGTATATRRGSSRQVDHPYEPRCRPVPRRWAVSFSVRIDRRPCGPPSFGGSRCSSGRRTRSGRRAEDLREVGVDHAAVAHDGDALPGLAAMMRSTASCTVAERLGVDVDVAPGAVEHLPPAGVVRRLQLLDGHVPVASRSYSATFVDHDSSPWTRRAAPRSARARRSGLA